MNVLDASLVTDALVVAGAPGQQARAVLAQQARLHVPAILTVEVVSALRAMLRRGAVDADAAERAARQAVRLRARRYPFEPFVERVWELRDTVTAYDAWYVALAEHLGAPLVTADERLRRASGPRCRVLGPQDALR